MDHAFAIMPPGPFDFEPSSWPTWIRRFEHFRMASGLKEKEGEYQVNSLIYTMGNQADDIFSSLQLSAEQLKAYEAVKTAFDGHFVRMHNVIYERAKFNKCCQEAGESAEQFITAVHKLAENCKYGSLCKEMIWDHIVVGIRDAG